MKTKKNSKKEIREAIKRLKYERFDNSFTLLDECKNYEEFAITDKIFARRLKELEKRLKNLS